MLRQADLFLNQKKPHLQLGLFAKGKVLIELVPKSLFDMQQLIASGCQHRSWQIETKLAQQLLDNITHDQAEQKNYANVATKAFNAQSCVTWCEEKLTQIGVDISSQQSWLDVVVA